MGAVTERCFDSNIIIDWLRGVPQADPEFEAVDRRVVSIVTWIEVLVGVRSVEEERAARRFLARFRVLDVTPAIAERAVTLRRERHLKVADSIIHATALHEGVELVTRNTRDFNPADPTIRVPYTL
ncbi:MAG: type II toxin-antitoxin system VapC family toxin [Dehalococcoidia bacterium]|nr:type II toxin-antitoxin system VapC family toxin [Dehalococcoidia bacterium]